jgi:hypothetical protein
MWAQGMVLAGIGGRAPTGLAVVQSESNCVVEAYVPEMCVRLRVENNNTVKSLI